MPSLSYRFRGPDYKSSKYEENQGKSNELKMSYSQTSSKWPKMQKVSGCFRIWSLTRVKMQRGGGGGGVYEEKS